MICVTESLYKYKPDFDPDVDNQSKKFTNMKAYLKAHFETQRYVDNWEVLKKSEEDERKFESRCHEVGLRIARLCYDGYKSGSSKREFEKEVIKAIMNCTDLGNPNNSKNFPERFRGFVAAEVKRRTAKFLNTRLPQTGFLPPVNIQADKGTTVHNTRQFTTVSAFTPESESLISVVYLGQPIDKNLSGDGWLPELLRSLHCMALMVLRSRGGALTANTSTSLCQNILPRSSSCHPNSSAPGILFTRLGLAISLKIELS